MIWADVPQHQQYWTHNIRMRKMTTLQERIETIGTENWMPKLHEMLLPNSMQVLCG